MSNFLDRDHLVSLDAIVRLLNNELQWCYQNPHHTTPERFDAFVKGVEQSKYLIIQMAQKMEDIGSAEPEAERWIPVGKKLPELGVHVQAYDGEDVLTAVMYSKNEWCISFDGMRINVTHWMPLPPPPEADHA